MEKKTCASCGEEKDLEEFNKQKLGKFGRRSRCKNCQHSEYEKYSRNDEVKNMKKLYARKRREGNEELRIYEREMAKERRRKKRLDAPPKIAKPKSDPKIIRKKYRDRRYAEDTDYKIKECMRSRVRGALKNNYKSAATQTLIGCSIEELKSHIESLWREGMSWENYGFYGWHIDHIKPCYCFDFTKEEDQKACFHYSNLQPLWATENLKKHRRYPIDQTEPSTQTNPDPQEKDGENE